MKENVVRRVIGLFVLMLAIMVYMAVVAVRNSHRYIKSNDWVNHTHAVIIDAGDILSYLHAGDSAVRTYLITGDKRDQAAYRNDYSMMIEKLLDAEALTRWGDEEKPLHQRILDLQLLISNRNDVTRSLVTNYNQSHMGLDGVRALFAANPDVESIGKIERAVGNLVGYEDDLLRQRDKEEYLQAQATRMTISVGVGVNFALLAFMLWLIVDDLAARRKAAQALEEANAQLEAKVQERTAELVKTNQSLKQENLERKWSYQALDHQLRYNQLIINSIAELVFVISRALNISRVNPAVVHQTSWEPQELIAQSIERVLQFPPDTASGSPQNPLITAMREGREIQERPAVLLTRSGKTTPVRFSLIPLHDQDKVVGGVVTVRVQSGAAQES
jgi:PAS domain-containing protein